MNDFRTEALSGAAFQYRIQLPPTKVKCDHHKHHIEVVPASPNDVNIDSDIAEHHEEEDSFLKFIHTLQDYAEKNSEDCKLQFYCEKFGKEQGTRRAKAEYNARQAQIELLQRTGDSNTDEYEMSDFDFQVMLAKAGIAIANQDDQSYVDLLRQVLAIIPIESILDGEEIPNDLVDARTLALKRLHERITSHVQGKIRSLEAFGESQVYFKALKKQFFAREAIDGIYVFDSEENDNTDETEIALDSFEVVAQSKKATQFRPPSGESLSIREKQQTSSFKRVLDELHERERQLKNRPSFKSRKIPESSLNASYNDIMAKAQHRREQLKSQRMAHISASIRPFSFTELKSYKDRAQKKPSDDESRPNTAPSSLCTKKISHRLEKTAAEDGRRKKQRAVESERNSGLTVNHTFKPQVNLNIPNFKAMQQKFENQLTFAKQKLTVSLPKPKPFAFHERSKESASPTSARQFEEDEQRLEKFRWPHCSPLPLPSSHLLSQKQFQSKTTRSVQLKQQARVFQSEKAQLVQDILDEEIARRYSKVNAIKAKLREYLKPRDEMLEATHQDRTLARQTVARQHELEYKMLLQDINERLEYRPLSFDIAL